MKVVSLQNRKASIVDAPEPKAKDAEVVVKLHAAPICGSNMHAYFGAEEIVNNGHEGAGEVVEADDASRVSLGDRVMVPAASGMRRVRRLQTRRRDLLRKPLADPRDVRTVHARQRFPVHAAAGRR